MKKSLVLLASFFLVSCAKEEFSANKGNQLSAINAVTNTSLTSCAQHTLIKPKVDILMLWDNSTSSNFINTSTKDALTNLVSSVSNKFDYRILSVPLIPTSTNTLYQASLVVSDKNSLSVSAQPIAKTKEEFNPSQLNFTKISGSAERGVDRAAQVIQANNYQSNNIFRQNAYTIVVLMSNGDDKSCELDTGYNPSCPNADAEVYNRRFKEKLLCLRGNSDVSASTCSNYGISSLDSTMLRFISITPLTACLEARNSISSRYSAVSTAIYRSPYTNSWPTATDDLRNTPDAYNLCNGYSNIFDGVNTAIQQTLIHHKYDFWPVAGSNDSVDPDTIRVTKVSIDANTDLANNSSLPSPTDGFKYIGVQNNHSTRYDPTVGENFTGKMVQLFGPDRLEYPNCLRVTYSEVKSNYGYVYLKNGEPHVGTIEVRINGNIVPQNATNGWDYMGLQYVGGSSIDTTNFKIVDYPYSSAPPSGYFLRLNGTAKFTNSTGYTVEVFYTSKIQ